MNPYTYFTGHRAVVIDDNLGIQVSLDANGDYEVRSTRPRRESMLAYTDRVSELLAEAREMLKKRYDTE